MDDLISMVAELKVEAERLKSITECEQEIDWCSNTLPCLPERLQGDTSERVVNSLLCHHWAKEWDLRDRKKWKKIPDQHHSKNVFLPTS